MLLMEHNVLNPKSSFDGSNQVATSAATHKVATFTGLVGLLEIYRTIGRTAGHFMFA